MFVSVAWHSYKAQSYDLYELKMYLKLFLPIKFRLSVQHYFTRSLHCTRKHNMFELPNVLNYVIMYSLNFRVGVGRGLLVAFLVWYLE